MKWKLELKLQGIKGDIRTLKGMACLGWGWDKMVSDVCWHTYCLYFEIQLYFRMGIWMPNWKEVKPDGHFVVSAWPIYNPR